MASPFQLPNGKPKTVIVTGGAGGIGAQTVRAFHEKGCNVVIADLPFSRDAAHELISSLSNSSRAMYFPSNIADWENMRALFRESKKMYGQVDIVIANAGMMESSNFFDFEEDEGGELVESRDSQRVIDVNLKGTLNSSIILIASTSGYFGGTGVVSYISTKHAVVGAARASQRKAKELNIRVNVLAPFFTPTYITGRYSDEWKKRGLPANTVEDVANAVISTSTDPARKGHHVMVAGSFIKEIEIARTALTKQWLGEDIADVMAKGGQFFDDMGGYPMPKPRE
ncbi:NAD(P)-binding protein [Paraphaeosphaeria sporulosa]|uniref:NAD(P)-binding protein n=1 Tax=Paraphaeosphaeria sporulosa TaxID=1460663 RepID=A0A177CHU6_9PLEO|nr:NAD(P)-binding protein [Paraphaeosphaeria sporulosa]OAG06347.1 NAD(P)-binding protein [Paraphaeosphaeria sporulosa]